MNRRAANAKTTLLQRGPRSHLVMIKELTRCRSKLGGNAASVRKRKFDSVRSRGSAHIGGRFPRRCRGSVMARGHERPTLESLKVSIHPWQLEGSNESVPGAPLGALRSATWHSPVLGLARQERRPIIVEIAKVSGNVDRTHFDLL
jgi:hypothetical protein